MDKKEFLKSYFAQQQDLINFDDVILNDLVVLSDILIKTNESKKKQ